MLKLSQKMQILKDIMTSSVALETSYHQEALILLILKDQPLHVTKQ